MQQCEPEKQPCALWSLTMEHSPVGMALVSLSGHFLTVNAALCDMLDYDSADLCARTFQSVTHADDLEFDVKFLADAMSGRIDSYRSIKRYVRSDGSILFGDLSVVVRRDEQGQPLHFISQIADLTERHAFAARLESAEDEIDAERRKAEAVYDTVAVGLVLLDATGAYQSFNSRHQLFMDLSFPEGHLGQAGQLGEVFVADQSRTLEREEMPTIRATAGEEFEDELIWVGADPMKRRALSVSAQSVRDRRGVFTGAALAYHDVTDMIRAIRVRDEFVASVSHELRTPLTSALAYLELLDGREDLDDEACHQVAAARRNAQRLSYLVADLLYSASAVSGAPLIGPFRVDIAAVIEQAVESARPHAERSGVLLETETPAALTVVVDGLRLRQALDNLLTNAITYSHSGGVVRVVMRGAEDHVEIEISDTGEGIEKDDLDEIFARFFRGKNARRRQMPGAGLGLHIVRTIVEAHGGDVSMESVIGEGTTVRVKLPKASRPTKPAAFQIRT